MARLGLAQPKRAFITRAVVEVIEGASAENAAATGTANNPSASIQPTAQQAAATGVGNNPSASVGASAGQATGTGTANDTTAAIAPTPTTAAATGTGNNPSGSVAPVAESAAATGTAFNPTVQTGSFTNAQAETAQATGEAFDASVSAVDGAVAPRPPVIPKGAVRAAQDRARYTGGASLDFGAPLLSISGEAHAEVASGAGTANNPSPAVAPVPTTAAATGQAFDATVTTGSQTFANAEVATATGTANNPGMAVAPVVQIAAANGIANDPSPSIQVNAGQAAGTGTANNPTITRAKFANAEAAVAAAVANNPQAAIAVLAEAAAAAGVAWDADVPAQYEPAYVGVEAGSVAGSVGVQSTSGTVEAATVLAGHVS